MRQPESVALSAIGRNALMSKIGTMDVRSPVRPGDTLELTDWDVQTYHGLISEDLSPAQGQRIVEPQQVYPRQDAVLAVHWHPETVPMELVRKRIDAMFPNRTEELIIPTQHNILTTYDEFSGVEVDCHSRGFNRKVQLLLHFEQSRLERADVFKAMLKHTFQYRSRQLFEFIDTIIDPRFDDRFQQAVAKTGASDDLIQFVKHYTVRLKCLFEAHEAQTPPTAVKNKLLTQYFEALRDHHDERPVKQALALLKAVKAVVKANFNLEFFYSTSDVIAEVRSLGGGIVIPHPEQFWPILMADYDVDGYEVWNPQSREYTEFLINVVNRENKVRQAAGRRPILIFMGDDCHLGEKVKEPRHQDPEKSGREIGVQHAWDDLSIRKSLITAGVDRRKVIRAYRELLLS